MYREKAAQLLGGAPLNFTVPLQGDDFEARITEAYEHGATHIAIGSVPFAYDELMPDNSDPYPNWSQGALSLFRILPPAAVAEFMPADLLARNLAWLDERFAVIRKLGLKATLNGLEPLWLPEAAYTKHPRWRGGQVELGRIAAKSYWTPSIDEPEVRELYRLAARALCERYPEIDRLSFWTNDCGAGLPWSTYSYPGMNGPTAYRQRDPGERIVGWLESIRQGALEAGSAARVNVHSFSFPPAELAAVRAKLGEHLYLNNVNGLGERISGGGANSGGGVVGTQTNPVQGHFNRPAFVEGLQTVFAPSDGRMRSIAVGHSTRDESYGLIRAYLDTPGQGVVRQHEILLAGARMQAGDAGAETLFKAWADVEKAIHCTAQLRQRGVSLSLAFGLTCSRWLVRPLVPEPHRLTPDETAHYRDMLFSCDPPEEDENLCNILGKPVFIGDSVVWMTRWCIDEAQKHLASAIRRVGSITASSPEIAENLALFKARVAALSCAFECGRLTIMYQHALDIAHIPRFAANPLDFDDNIQFDQRALELRKIARMDLDNTLELIDLLRAFGANQLLAQAATGEKESVFMYGPDLVDLLERKRAIMIAHWHDYERLYPAAKRYEFEPSPRDQLSVAVGRGMSGDSHGEA